MGTFRHQHNILYLTKVATLFTLIVIGKSCEPLDKGTLSPIVTEPVLLLISIDGYASSYQGKANTPVLDSLASAGIKADGFLPVFPTKTFPNHYTQVTGLYPESHGIISNRMYDPIFKQYFSLSSGTAARNGKWYEGEPIWVTAKQQGIVTATMFWPGSEAEIRETRPDFFFAYNGAITNEERVAQVLEWMEHSSNRPGFISLYFEQVDRTGHTFGPNSDEVLTAVEDIDYHIGILLEGVKALNLNEMTNVIVVSDHGMAALSRDKVIFLDDYVALENLEIVNWSPVLEIIPEPNQVKQVYKALQGVHPKLKVYQKGNYPKSWHLKHHRRLTPIMALAEPGWSISSHRYFTDHPQAYKGGAHGYQPLAPEMQGIFIASGPSFLTGPSLGTIESVHLYELLCYALKIHPSENQGNLKVWKGIVK